MAFTKIGPNARASTEGFSVTVHIPVGITYAEGERRIRVDSQVMAEPAVLIYLDTIRAWEPDGELVDHDVRQQVETRIAAALADMGLAAQGVSAEPRTLKPE